MAILKTGYNIIINQKVGGVNTPIYPFTKTANVMDAEGKSIDEIVAGLAAKEHGNHVPDFSGETVSNLRFLRNDNTWAEIQAASTTQAGVVQLSDATDSEDSTVAATAKAVKAVMDAVADLEAGSSENYVNVNKLGVADGVATLDANGLVPSTQLPSYVDDVVEVTMAADLASATKDGEAVTPEAGKIYVDLTSGKTYRWSGSMYVVISETLALGETASTAFDGARGKIAYDHATTTETNPHGTTAADVGLGNVENKDSATIRGEITSANVTDALGFTPLNDSVKATASNDGVMSSTYAAKLDNCMQTSVATSDPSFADGIWFEIVQ